MTNISLNDLLHTRPALIIGDRATSTEHDRAALLMAAMADAERFGMSLSAEIRSDGDIFFDAMRAWNSLEAEKIERRYVDGILSLSPSLDIKHLANVQWSAIISLARNTALEQALQTKLDSAPTTKALTIVSHPSVILPLRTLPIFRLLGDPGINSQARKLSLSASDYILKKQMWQDLLSQFSDAAKNGAVIVLGFRQQDRNLQDCIGALISLKGPIPKRFVFLEAPGGSTDPILLGMLRNKAEVITLSASISEFCDTAAQVLRTEKSSIAQVGIPKSLARLLADFSDTISVPISKLPDDFVVSQRMTELRDALFRPMAIDWRPFVSNLDLQRDQLADAVSLVDDLLAAGQRGTWPTLIVKGEAGVGKTTFLKRLAVRLCSEETLVLWIRRRSAVSLFSLLKDFLKKLHPILKENELAKKIRLVFICDDPVSQDFPAEDFVFLLQTSGIRALAIFGVRNSDELLNTLEILRDDRFPTSTLQINYKLSADELAALEDFLVLHRIAESKDRAHRMIASVPANSASDILCSLWFLVPETRHQLEASIENEYLRLGMPPKEAIASLAASAARENAALARRSYEAVAVASSFDLAVPIEVLVRAVAAGSYEEWLENFGAGKALWGLLYDDFDAEQGTYSYRTRNRVVTDVLVRLIDQGIGHAGRFRVLKDLVAACQGGGPLYRQFLVQLLIKRRTDLDFLTFEEGNELFELALEESGPDQALLMHHRALWTRHNGHDARASYDLLQAALAVAAGDAAQSENRANIHVSLANTVAERLKHGDLPPEDALALVQNHLTEARQRATFDPHVPYVLAKTFVNVARVSRSRSVTIESACKALSEVDRGLLAIGGSAKRQAQHFAGVERLLELQREVAKIFMDQDLADIAEEMEKQGSFFGAELQARLMLRDASSASKGKRFNDIIEVVDRALDKIPADLWQRQLGLREVRALTTIRWRIAVQRGAIDWNRFLADVDFLRGSPMYASDPIWRYYHALAMFHLGHFAEAAAEFHVLRPTVKSIPASSALRNFYVGKEGAPKRLQGIVHSSHNRRYISLNELELDAELHEPPGHLREGDTTHCYLVFRLSGFRAFFGDPSVQDLEIPHETE